MTLLFACAPFMTVEDAFDAPCACDLDSTVPADVALVEALIDQASDVLSLASGSQVTGVCEATVRPISLCRGPSYQTQYGYPDWTDRFGGLDTILLRGPAPAVIEILIDGVVISPTDYGLLDGLYLFRRSASWPTANDLTLDSTQAGTFEITYRFGRDYDKLTNMAAIEYFCELLADAVAGTTNSLGRGVNAANLQGVQVTIRDRAQALRDGDDVNPVVSRFLSIYGGAGMQAGAWAPELEQRWELVEVLGPSGS